MRKELAQAITEYDVHLAICDYTRLKYPGVPFNSDGAGQLTTRTMAGMAKPLRFAAGWPDWFLAAARGKYHGLFLEIKKPGADPFTPDGRSYKNPNDKHIKAQNDMMELLQAQGYCCDFAVGADDGIWKIDWYMRLEDQVV